MTPFGPGQVLGDPAPRCAALLLCVSVVLPRHRVLGGITADLPYQVPSTTDCDLPSQFVTGTIRRTAEPDRMYSSPSASSPKDLGLPNCPTDHSVSSETEPFS